MPNQEDENVTEPATGDVKVVDTISDNDDVDFNDEDIGTEDDSGSSGGSSSNQNKQDDVQTVEGDNGIEQAVPSVEDPETGREVRIDNPAVGTTGEQGDRVRTAELTDGERSEVIVEGPGGSGAEAAAAAPKLAEKRIQERREEIREQQKQQQPSQKRQTQAQQDKQRIDPTKEFTRPSKKEREQIVRELAKNIEKPENLQQIPEPSITAEPIEREESFTFATNRELAQGTDIPGEKFFDRSQPTTTGLEGIGVTNIDPETFTKPAAQGLQTQRDVSEILQSVGVDQQTAKSVGRSIGTGEATIRSATGGIVEAPQQVSRFVENPEEEIERTVEGLEKTETGQVATTPEEAVILAGSDVQERADIRQEVFGGSLALSGVGTAGAGIASGGAVRGVTAPTTRLTRTQPEIETERFQGQFLENRLAASETDVTPEGEIAQGQQFVETGTRGQTRGVIGEESTQGVTEQPLTFIRVEDPEGTRTFAARTTAGFEATQDQTEGLARTQLLEISRDQELQNFEGIRTETQLQDFTVESVSDEIIRGRAGDTQLKDIESALFGESGDQEFRGLARTDVRQRRDEGVTETFSRVEGAAAEDQPTVAEGAFVTEENLEPVGISRRVDADERFGRPFTTRELTEEDLQDLDRISEEVFGEDLETDARRTDTETDTDDTIDRDTGDDQQLMQEQPDRETTEFEEQTLGVGIEQAAQEAAETGVRRNLRREFEPLKSNMFDDVTGSIITGTSISTTDTDQLTGLNQEQRERQETRDRQDQGLELDNIQREEQDQDITEIVGQDQELDQPQQQRTDFEPGRPPQEFDFTPRNRPSGGAGLGFDFRNDQTIKEEAVEPKDAEKGFQRQASIDSIIIGKVQTVSKEEFEELQDQQFTGLESRSILRVENGENNDNLDNQLRF